WLNNNAGRRFADEVVRELYSIDAPIGTHALEQIVDAAEAWVKRGPSDKAIRVYNQAGVHSKLDGFKPGTNFPRVPYEMSVGATRTVVATPAVALRRGRPASILATRSAGHPATAAAIERHIRSSTRRCSSTRCGAARFRSSGAQSLATRPTPVGSGT